MGETVESFSLADRVWQIAEPLGWSRDRVEDDRGRGSYFYEPYQYEPSLFLLWVSDDGLVHFPMDAIRITAPWLPELLSVLTVVTGSDS